MYFYNRLADFWGPISYLMILTWRYLVPAPTTAEPIVVLPTNAPYETKFSKTTTYYWPNFELNATTESVKDGEGYQEAEGPFGFGTAIELSKDKSQVLLGDF